MENNHEGEWVAQRLGLIQPKWNPNILRAGKLLANRLEPRRERKTWVLATAAVAICLAAVTLPQIRAFAQQLWTHYVLHHVDVVRLDFSDLPMRAQLTTGGPPQAAADLDDAEAKAGFRPELPTTSVLVGSPSFSIMSAMAVEQTIHVGEIQAALDKVGAGYTKVPPGWEGVLLRADVGPIVDLSYPDNVRVLEAKPIQLSFPAGFPLEGFAELAFRTLGKSAQEARLLAQGFVSNPAWMMGIPADEIANIEQVSLRNGQAVLVEEPNDKGTAGRVTVFRSTSTRLYCVLTNSRQLALQVAETLP